MTFTARKLIAGRYKIAVYCGCGHNAWLDLVALARRDGPETPTDRASLLRRLQCSICGRRCADIKLHPETDSSLSDRPYTAEEAEVLAMAADEIAVNGTYDAQKL